jgi:hypothetical protein
MELHFALASDGTPMTKTFKRKPDSSYEKTGYPNVFALNSARVVVTSTEHFFLALQNAAEQHACLLTGHLDSDLHNESRARRALQGQRSEWVVFDVDGLADVDTVEQFITTLLPKPFHDVSYVSQHSCSHGIVGSGLRAHVFFRLETPIAPEQIKLWLTERNLDIPTLSAQLELAAGGGSLRYPLDRLANDHGRIVFIAAPICAGFDDPFAGKRIELVTKATDNVRFDFSSSSHEAIRKKERKVIQQLRDQQHLPRRSARLVSDGNFDVLIDADKVEVNEWWDGNGYIHANLNGGDSGAYWVNPKRPKYIHNFKGEPSLVLREVAPDWWKTIKPLCTADEMLVFRDPISGRYHAGRYDAVEDRHSGLNRIQRSDIRDWAEDIFGAAAPDPIPQYDLVFDPTLDKVVDRDNRFVNEFQPTDYMRLQVEAERSYPLPATIGKLLLHLCGNDEEALEWFLNWLACVFQYRTKTKTAMVLHGVPGTGKGLLYSKILVPLFGPYAQNVQLEQIREDMFNGFLGRSLIAQFEEAKACPEMRNKLFHWIADDKVSLRKMYQESVEQDTYCNFIFVSNQLDAVKIENLDRRFTVARRQEQPLQDQPDGRKGVMTDEEIDKVLPTELAAFALYLLSRPASVEIARKSLDNEAKRQMYVDGMTVADLFVEAVKSGDLAWFLDRAREAGNRQGSSIPMTAAILPILARWIPYANSREPCPVFKSDLLTMYNQIADQTINEVAFGNLLKNRGFQIRAKDRVVIGVTRKSGRYIAWRAESAALDEYRESTITKVQDVTPPDQAFRKEFGITATGEIHTQPGNHIARESNV